jgi:hypothetical protein
MRLCVQTPVYPQKIIKEGWGQALSGRVPARKVQGSEFKFWNHPTPPKSTKDLRRHFSREGVLMTNKHKKQCLALLTIRKCK